jgi:hypothetical protein
MKATRAYQVITYQAPNGQTIDISRAQERKLTAAGKWPRNESGEYCSVSYGLHRGRPTYEEMDELLALCL